MRPTYPPINKKAGWDTIDNLVVTPKVEQVHIDFCNFAVKTFDDPCPFELIPFTDSVIPAKNIRLFLRYLRRILTGRLMTKYAFNGINNGRYIRNLHFYRVDTENFVLCGGDFKPISYVQLRKDNLVDEDPPFKTTS